MMGHLQSSGLTGSHLAAASDALIRNSVEVGVMTSPSKQGPLELNPFAYVANNPLRWTDPTGLDASSPGGGDDGGDVGGVRCRLIGRILIGGITKPWLPSPIAVLLCIYDCNQSCPGKMSNIIFRKQLVFNPPYQCPPTVRRRMDE